MNKPQFGPTGALVTIAEQSEHGIRVSLIALLPVVANLACQVRLLGRGRNELAKKGSRPEVRTTPCPTQRPNLRGLCGQAELIQCSSLRKTSLTAREFLIPKSLVSKTSYLSLYFGTNGIVARPDWQRSPSTFLLEVPRSDFFDLQKQRTVSTFWLMTRGDAAERLNRLRQAHPFAF